METFAHVPGTAHHDYAQPAGSRRLNLRGNLVGTTERMVGESGVITQRSVYTAFGELVHATAEPGCPSPVCTRYGYCGAWGYESASGVGTRYQYAGAWGYQSGLYAASGDGIPFVHVGHRWYDPSTGRFMQRDPIGILGGLNVYEYVGSRPSDSLDPSGLNSSLQ